LSKQDVTRLAETFTKIITDHGGSVVKNEYWGLRALAYPINKNKKGHYTLLGVDMPVAALNELNRNLGITEEVIRHMTVRVDAIEEGPSALIRGRGDEETPIEEAA
jgi:small subunit ribosomal protein S6